MRNKAYRRLQRDKHRHKAFRIYRDNGVLSDWWDEMSNQERADWMGRHCDNHSICSCPMCCNPRHSKWNKGDYKLTRQEKKAKDKEHYDINHYYYEDEDIDFDVDIAC